MGETFTCKYCGKVYKTCKGLEKHHCEQMDRYETITDTTIYVFNIVNLNYKIYPKALPTVEEELKYIICNSKYYGIIKALEKWALETNPLNFVEYVKYLRDNQVNYKSWTKDLVYRNYLIKYLREEPLSIAINRGENFLKSIGVTIDSISSNRLYLAIKYGTISKKYLDYLGVNVNNKLDSQQFRDVRPMLVEEYKGANYE